MNLNSNISFLQGMAASALSISAGLIHFVEIFSPLFAMGAVIIGIICGIRTFQVKTIEREIKQIELDKLKEDEQATDQS